MFAPQGVSRTRLPAKVRDRSRAGRSTAADVAGNRIQHRVGNRREDRGTSTPSFRDFSPRTTSCGLVCRIQTHFEPTLLHDFPLEPFIRDHGVWRTIYGTAIGFRPNRFQSPRDRLRAAERPCNARVLRGCLLRATSDEGVGHRNRAQLKKLKRLKQSAFHLFYTKYLN